MKRNLILLFLVVSIYGFSQVTKSSINGKVKTYNGESLPGATVEIKHVPTGTKYFSSTDIVGSYAANSVRPGGPYSIKVTMIGYKTVQVDEINAPLGNTVTVDVQIEEEITKIEEVKIVTQTSKSSYNKGKTGAGQQFSTRELNAIPVVGSRSINGITKYNANAGSGGTFGGQDSRLNNFTIDGSIFNNGFGLGNDSQAGGRTGSTAISLDAIEQLQVNIAPFDVRQSGFVGSGINAVTRSGSNDIEGSAYYSWRSNKKGYIGEKAGNVKITPGVFDEKIYGARVGFPIIKDKLFFFGNFESIENIRPATNFTSSGSPNGGSQISEASFLDLTDVSNILNKAYGYQTGPFENYDNISPSRKFLARLDWNINDNHKLTARYVQHDSKTDVPISNSNSLGQGNRVGANSLSYKNSGYEIQDNTKSIVIELDSKFSERWSNNFIGGYDIQEENRGLQGGGIFPTIDIRKGTNNYISAGLDPFTPSNLLDYSTLHFTNNVTGNFGKHTLLFGANYEYFTSNNNFFPGSNGVYIFNSLADFKSLFTFDQNGNPLSYSNGNPLIGGISVADPSKIARFQYRYSALPGAVEPLQVLKSNKFDLYAQDDYKPWDNLKLTFGVRATAVDFSDTALENITIKDYTYRNGEKFNTKTLPKTQFLFEPRLGFNLDIKNNNNLILRGGTGIFTGRPPMVFVSNAIGNNGVLTGFIDVSGDDLINGGYGFTNNVNEFTPSNPAAPSSYDLAFVAEDFKFPQVWKTNIAIDSKLFYGFRGSIEGIFNQNINEIFYYNANLENPTGKINNAGDNRPFYGGTDNAVRINNNVSNAIVLDNSNKGYFYSTTLKIEYPYKKGLWGNFAYTYSNARDLLSAGSIAAGSWTGARSVLGNNNLQLSDSNNNTPHRLVGTLGYKIEYGKEKGGAATSINLGYIGEKTNPFSYFYAGDINGDRVNNNDLLYVPNNASELRFVDITANVGGVTTVVYSAAEQAIAFDKYIEQDEYLKSRRGKYAERNASILPWLHRFDVSVTQDFFLKISGKKQTFQFRADILNAGNLINSNWGVSQRASSQNILNVVQSPSSANNYIPGVNLGIQTDDFGRRYLAKDTFQQNSSVFDVWQAQFTLRYIFGK